MSHRHVLISNPAKLSSRNEQLVIRPIVTDASGDKYTIPLEDIRSVMLEDRATIVTSALLSKLAEFNISLYTCDEKHLPNGVMLAYNQHSRALKVLKSQLHMNRPFAKRLWQSIVKRKIENQAGCLEQAGCQGGSRLRTLARTVESGDRSNVESHAARLYFQSLFSESFVRRNDDFANSAMNYGYAIVRGQVARALCSYGYLPSIGLHHHSELNIFNLADDFMEPFRPIVDLLVASELTGDEHDDLTPRHKQCLYGVLAQEVLVNNQKFNVTAAIDVMVSSFTHSISTLDPGDLLLPAITAIRTEVYE